MKHVGVTADPKDIATQEQLGSMTPSLDLDDVSGLVPALAAKEPAIAAGTTSQYWRGDKTWQTLNKAAVGLGNVDNTSDADKPVSTAQASAIATKQPTIAAGSTSQFWRGDKTWQDFAGSVRSAVLTGISTATSTVIAAADSVLVAIGKLQAQVNLRAPLASPALTGVPLAPTAAAGTNSTQLANTAFVKSQFVAGVNGNGAYFLAPGLQICRNTLAIPSGGSVTWTYPLAFAASPQVFVTTSDPTAGQPDSMWLSETSATNAVVFNPNASGATNINLLAIF